MSLSKPVICLFGTPSPTRSSELDDTELFKNFLDDPEFKK